MKHFWIVILTAFIVGEIGNAQPQSRTIHQRTLDNSSALKNNVFTLVYNNPAMKRLQHSSTLTTLYLGGEYAKEDIATLIQEGDGLRMGSVNVTSFIRQKNSSLWGEAYYHNGKKLGRCWNETSDYSLLYPYVMGDTVGGSLKSEQYFFSGGYARHLSKYIIGAEGSYKATIEYRNADPRPKNLTGDLKVKIGAARYLTSKYLLGVTAYARKYKQTNDLAFYDELGVPNIYHFTGLGTDYYRFRGAKGESFYKGHSFGTSIDLLSATTKGLSASIQYQNFQFDKVISTLNELPMASVKEDLLKSEMAYRKANGAHSWGVRGRLDYTRRIGSENIFGGSSGNIFTQIGTQKKYMNKIYNGEIAGVYEFTASHQFRVSLLPAVSYTDIESTYLFPHKEMKVGFFANKMDIRVAYPFNRWLLFGEVGYTNRFATQSRLDIAQGQKIGEEKMNQPIRSNYEALKATRNGFHCRLRSDFTWNNKYSIFLAVNYDYSKDQRHSVYQNIMAQLGFTF